MLLMRFSLRDVSLFLIDRYHVVRIYWHLAALENDKFDQHPLVIHFPYFPKKRISVFLFTTTLVQWFLFFDKNPLTKVVDQLGGHKRLSLVFLYYCGLWIHLLM